MDFVPLYPLFRYITLRYTKIMNNTNKVKIINKMWKKFPFTIFVV